MKPGHLSVNLNVFGTFLHSEHDVEEEQFEPGIPDEEQARRHVLDFGFVDVNLKAELEVLEWLAVSLEMPIRTIVQRVDFENAQGGLAENFDSIHHRNETVAGPADLALGTRWRVLTATQELPWVIDVLAAVSFPTGGTEPDPFVLGRGGETHQHMFTGSGTVDPRGGVETTLSFDSLSLVGFLAMGGALYANDYGYQRGLMVASGLGVKTSFGLDAWSFLLQQEVFHERPSRWGEQAAENSGRTDLIATAAVSWRFAPQWSSQLLVKVPYYTQAEGGQLSTPVALGLGLAWSANIYGEEEK